MNEFQQTNRTTLKRLPKRGTYDRQTVFGILDEALVCHVGFALEGQPYVIPTGYVRIDDILYIHGSAASRMLRSLATGIDVCVTVTLLDGMVLARSAFHHSMNYRSVVIFGRAEAVESPSQKLSVLRAFLERMAPGRWQDVREPDDQELKATLVLAVALQEVSAKIRTGPPIEDERDLQRDVWGGVVPIRMITEQPVPDAFCASRFPRRN